MVTPNAGCVVGVDIGGTTVRAAAIDHAGTIHSHRQIPTEAAQGSSAGLGRIKTLIENILQDTPDRALAGIGIGSTGPLDRARGRIQNPYTLPTWDDVDIVSALVDHFHVPVTLENDADAAALGEYWQGAGLGVSRLFAMTVGTGVGTALITDGAIYRGWNELHGEGGHHVVNPFGPACYCGARGCLESIIAGPAIARLAQQKAAETKTSQLYQQARGNLAEIDASMVSAAAREGDRLASATMNEVATYFAIGLFNIIQCFIPEVIVLSGSVMKDFDLLEPTVRSYLQQCSVLVPANQVQIVPASLGDRAGVFGAAYSVLQQLSWHRTAG